MDPYEEERRARFVEPINAMQQIFARVQSELVEAKGSRVPSEAQRLFDGALDLLFHCLNLGNPLAFRRERDGQFAFCWSDHTKAPAAFQWVVCKRNGSWTNGTEQSQAACEAVVDAMLKQEGG